LPLPTHGVNKKPRVSVSAEVYGQWNKKEDFKPRVIEKSEDTKNKYFPVHKLSRLKSILGMSFMFNSLEQKDRDVVIMAMEEVKRNKGDNVIIQGEDGGDLYVVESGILKCTKIFVIDLFE
jgi:cAMP-dependent protein kinase regulator